MKKITKLMLTLALLVMGTVGVKAAWEQVYKIEYSDYTSFPFYVMGFTPEFIDGVMIDGGSSSWHQYFIADNIPTQVDGNYTVKAMVKASTAITINVNMGWGWGDGQQKGAQVAIPAEWTEIEWSYEGVGGTSCNLVAQPGVQSATIEWKYLKVGYEGTTVWKDIIVNGNMEGESAECFYITEQGVGGPFLAPLTAGVGKDGSKAVKVESYNNPANDWDTQFFIRLPYQLPAGTSYKVSFDYKATQEGKFQTQVHTEPGGYIDWRGIGEGTFTTEWKTFEGSGTIADYQSTTEKPMQTIAFNLGLNKKATKFFIDNVKFEVPEDALSTLTLNPAENPKTYPEPITSMDIVGTFPGLDWDPTAGWDMVQSEADEAVWTLSKVLDIPASTDGPTTTYKYKATANDVWTRYSLPNGDDATIEFGTDEHPFGKYKLTFTANVKTHTLTLDAEEIYTMTAAGNNTTLFGMAWDPTDTNNDLTKNEDGTFSITYEGINLEEGQIIQFKVVKNHSWDVSYPEENYQLNIPRSSNYDVTITFYPENKDVVATLKDNEAISSYYLVGGEKDAAWTVGDVLTKDEDAYSIEIPYSSEYSFAIAPNTALNDLKDKVVNWNALIRPTETTSVDFENVSGEVSTTNNNQNWKMVEKGNGEEKEFNTLFTYDSNAGTWAITASTTTTIGETGYATYSNAKPYTVKGATANFVTIPNRYAVLVPQDADAILPAMTGAGKNAGVILSGAGEVIINAVAKGAEATATGIDENLLAGSGNYSYGISTQFADNDPYTAYIFAQPEGKELGFYIADLNAGADLPAHKAFLAVPKGADAREFIGFEAGETTSIADNNRVTTTNNGDVYNLNGQRVAQPTKGLYIVNGKKYVVK